MRDGKGRIIAGSTLPEEHRKAISEGQILRHRRQRLEVKDAHVEQKRCTICKEWRKVPEEYVMRNRTLASGEIRRYAAGECKYCGRKRAERWKKAYITEHGEEAWKEKQKGYQRNRDQQKQRRYQREYGRIKRMEEGAEPRGPWKKYEHESGSKGTKKVFVSSTPLRIWWEAMDTETRQWINLDESLSRTVRRYAYESVNVEIDIIDMLVDRLSDPGLYARLAPGL